MASPESKSSPLSARLFRRGALSCPNCKTLVEGHPKACPRCGFHHGLVTQQIPGPAPAFSTVMDFLGLLGDAEPEIQAKAARIGKSFPQVTPGVCLVNCPENIPTQMLASWVLNQAPSGEGDPCWRALLLVDPLRKNHAFAAGYQLEPFLAREEIERLMDDAGGSFYYRSWVSGVADFFDGFFNLLRNSCEVAQRAEQEARSKTTT